MTLLEREFHRFLMRHGSQKAAALALGVSAQYVNDLRQGRRQFSEVIARKLGFERVWRRRKREMRPPRKS